MLLSAAKEPPCKCTLVLIPRICKWDGALFVKGVCRHYYITDCEISRLAFIMRWVLHTTQVPCSMTDTEDQEARAGSPAPRAGSRLSQSFWWEHSPTAGGCFLHSGADLGPQASRTLRVNVCCQAIKSVAVETDVCDCSYICRSRN